MFDQEKTFQRMEYLWGIRRGLDPLLSLALSQKDLPLSINRY
jgi:hypothetical protein